MQGDKSQLLTEKEVLSKSGPSWNGPRAETVSALGCYVNEDANEVEAFAVTFLPTVLSE
jgi:hypothetical protein